MTLFKMADELSGDVAAFWHLPLGDVAVIFKLIGRINILSIPWEIELPSGECRKASLMINQ